MKRPIVTVALVLLAAAEARAADDRAAGLFTKARQLPLVQQSLQVEVRGSEALIQLHQVFANPGAELAQADFRLPLPQGATLDGFAFHSKGRWLEAALAEKAEAEAAHRRAVDAGRRTGLQKSDGAVATFSVHPIEAGSVMRVRSTLRFPIATALGTSELALPVGNFLGRGRVRSLVELSLHTEAALDSWSFVGGTPLELERSGTSVRFVASVDALAHLSWREARAELELAARAVPIPEGMAIELEGFASAEGREDQVRSMIALVDGSFSMRRKLEFVEAALSRLGPAAEVVGVAEIIGAPASPALALAQLHDGAYGHRLDPLQLRRAIRAHGCERGGRCVLITDGAGAAEALHGVEVPSIALMDTEESAYFAPRLPSGTGRFRVDADSGLALARWVDGAVRPRLRVVMVDAPGLQVLGPEDAAAVGSVLRMPLVAPEPVQALALELELDGQRFHRTVPVEAARDPAGVRRRHYVAVLGGLLRRYAEAPEGGLRAEVVRLSLRENIATPFTARQVADPELSLVDIKGGDPHFTLPLGPQTEQALAIYPFGEVQPMVADPSRAELVDRFLAPRGWRERWYRVDALIPHPTGARRRSSWYRIDDGAPELAVSVEAGRLLVQGEDLSSVLVRTGERTETLGGLGGHFSLELAGWPSELHLQLRDRAGNLRRARLRIEGEQLRVEEERHELAAAPALPRADRVVSGKGYGRYPSELDGERLRVRIGDHWLELDGHGLALGSANVSAVLRGSDETVWLGFEDGRIVEGIDGRARERRASDGHPVRALVEHRGRRLAAVLGKGVLHIGPEGARPLRLGLPTRFVSDLRVHRGVLFVGTLYDGLWRRVRGRTVRTRLEASHVDRLEVVKGRLQIESAFGRFERRGTDAFRRLGGWRPALRSGGTMALLQHRGRVYAADFEQGLRVHDGEAWQSVEGAPPHDARARHVNALGAFEGRLFAGTESGLFEVRPSGWQRLGRHAVYDLSVGQDRLLIASSGGAFALDRAGLRRLDPDNGSARGAFSAVLEHDGVVYLGGLDGLFVLDQAGAWRREADYGGGWVTALAWHGGQLLVGSYARGVWARGDAGWGPLEGLADQWVPFHGLREMGDGLFVGGLGMAPRILGPDGVIRRLPVGARDANDALPVAEGWWIGTSDGLRWAQPARPARPIVGRARALGSTGS